MAEHFLHGITPYGSANHQIAWFAILEDWLVNTVGWTVASGAGSTDIVFTSTGESGTFTKLFVHIWAVGFGVFGDVQDDAVGTHKTTQADAIGVMLDQQVEYWFAADKNTILMIVPFIYDERIKYLGCVLPMALNPADETNYMVASSNGLGTAAVLHHHTGAWDVNITNYSRSEGGALVRSPVSGEFGGYSLYADRYDAIVGQYKFLAVMAPYNITPRDRIVSTIQGATSEWECFYMAGLFLAQVAGAVPGDVADGTNFAYQTGVEANPAAWLNVTLPAFMTAIGWTDMGPALEFTIDRLFHSNGEDGTRDIYIVVGWEIVGNPYWWLRVYDDAVGTHMTGFGQTEYRAGNWPGTYHMSADRDCLCFCWIDTVVGCECPQWVGMTEPYNPGIANSHYLSGIYSIFPPHTNLLLTQDGLWGIGAYAYNGAAVADGSSPNLYDGTTYVLWPMFLAALVFPGAGTPRYPAGTMKYIMYVDGAPLALNDTITVGAQVYQVFTDQAVPKNYWALRIA